MGFYGSLQNSPAYNAWLLFIILYSDISCLYCQIILNKNKIDLKLIHTGSICIPASEFQFSDIYMTTIYGPYKLKYTQQTYDSFLDLLVNLCASRIEVLHAYSQYKYL
jgi:hypothetical protein